MPGKMVAMSFTHGCSQADTFFAIGSLKDQIPDHTCCSPQIIDNIVQNPLEAKYRSIKRSNKGFASRVGAVPGGDDCMRALGFVASASGEEWVLHPSATAWPVLQAGRAKVQAALGRYAGRCTYAD